MKIKSIKTSLLKAPNNDYSQHFVNTGQRAQNFIRDAGSTNSFLVI